MARIILSSYLVRFPLGGYASWILQWLVGFQRLGHDVFFVEKAGWKDACFNPVTGESADDASYGVGFVRDLLERFGMGDRWCFVDRQDTYHGLSQREVQEAFQSTDLYVDNMQQCEWREESRNVPCRILVDGEPGYRQIRLATGDISVAVGDFHHYYTVGKNVAKGRADVPDTGIPWRAIYDPVVPELFSSAPPPHGAAWTTVMSWTAHKPLEYNGRIYGQKDVEFERFLDLPHRIRDPIEVAFNGRQIPRQRLGAAGWRLKDSIATTISFDSWQDYLANSRGEFSVAKNVFVATNSGFFSDRSAAYLASARPVVMQETGFSAYLPCGEGLFAVQTVEEAADAIEQVSRDYKRHSAAALAIAHEHLNARSVLATLLDEVGI